MPCKLCTCGDKNECSHCVEHFRNEQLEIQVAAGDPEAEDHMNQGFASISECKECSGKFFTGDWWEIYCSGCYDLHYRPVHEVERYIYLNIFSVAHREGIKSEDLQYKNKFDADKRDKIAADIMEIIAKCEEVKKVTGKYHIIVNEKNVPGDISWIYEKKKG